MSRQQRGGGTGEVARGAGYAALLGALLIGVAVVIGIVDVVDVLGKEIYSAKT